MGGVGVGEGGKAGTSPRPWDGGKGGMEVGGEGDYIPIATLSPPE